MIPLRQRKNHRRFDIRGFDIALACGTDFALVSFDDIVV